MGSGGIVFYWNVLIDKLSYMGSAGIVFYWNVWIDKLSNMGSGVCCVVLCNICAAVTFTAFNFVATS